jgi:succinyl-CoA synthetase alpha subunit
MAVLVSADTRVICQGLTGRAATYHCARMVAYGTRLVGGVTPGKGGRTHLDVPVFDHVRDAVAATRANASLVFVPPANAARAMIDCIEAEVPLVVAVTERIPLQDMIRVREALDGSRTTLVGPNSQGVLAPGIAQLGVMTTVNAKPGRVGVASRSASLTSEIVAQLTAAGLGQSTTIGVGGDPVHGLSLAGSVDLFLDDPDTDGIVVIGEIGGTAEEVVAEKLRGRSTSKPIVALIAGRNAPREKRMGHAGAFASGRSGSAEEKAKALEGAGAIIAESAHLVGETMRKALEGKR